jgi:putative endonuclease
MSRPERCAEMQPERLEDQGDTTITTDVIQSVQSVQSVQSKAARGWCLYLLACENGSLYAGITNDLKARYEAHVNGRGARYTRSFPPIELVGSIDYPNKSEAARAEWLIRTLRADQKREFILGKSIEEIRTSPRSRRTRQSRARGQSHG